MPRPCDSRKRILVTGSAAYLGSRLIDRPLGEGHGAPRVAIEEGLAPTIAYFTELTGGVIAGAEGAR